MPPQADFQMMKLPDIPHIPKIPKFSEISGAVQGVRTVQEIKKVTTPVPPDIKEIQKQIADIIRLNETLKLKNQSQIKEIQRVMEQARIHQKILSELKSLPNLANPRELTSADSEAILEQEKLRVISQDTEKSKKLMVDLSSSEAEQKKAT